MPTFDNRFSRVRQSSVGVATYTVGMNIALFNAAQVFNFLSKAGPNVDSIIKSKHETLMKAKQCNTDLGCEFKDSTTSNSQNTPTGSDNKTISNVPNSTYINQIKPENVSSGEPKNASTHTDETPPIELQLECNGFLFQEHCMPYIERSLSITLLIDILLFIGLSKLPKCSLVGTLLSVLEYLKHVLQKWQNHILTNNPDNSAVTEFLSNDAYVPLPRSDYIEQKPSGKTAGDLPDSSTLSSIRPHTSIAERQGRPATREDTTQYGFELNRSPSPIFPTFPNFHGNPVRGQDTRPMLWGEEKYLFTRTWSIYLFQYKGFIAC